MTTTTLPTTASADIATLIANWKPGFGLPGPFFTRDDVFELDLQRVNFRQWLLAGHVSRIPGPGDYFRYDVADESVLIVRDESDEIHAFLNQCRHRGSLLCQDESGTVSNFVCPYHAWNYGTDGCLKAARHLPDSADKSQLGLHPVHLVEVEGLIFVCLADTPPDLTSIVDDIAQFFGPHKLAEAKTCERRSYRIQANWKLVTENFWECYHCGPTHPELAEVMGYVRAFDSKRAKQEHDDFTAEWEQQTAARGLVTGSSISESGLCQNTVRVPIRKGFVTQSRGGQPVAPLMGEYDEYDGGITAIQFFPLNWIVACNDYAMLSRFTPVSRSGNGRRSHLAGRRGRARR